MTSSYQETQQPDEFKAQSFSQVTPSTPGNILGNVEASPAASGGCSVCKSKEMTQKQRLPYMSFVYALGRIEARFPSLAIEKEFAQAVGRAETGGLTDRQALNAVLSERLNRYLLRHLCWVLSIEGIETYMLLPRDSSELDLLLDALRPTPDTADVDIVIGLLGDTAPSTMCNGLMLPTVVFDQIYSFDIDSLIQALPRPESIKSEQFDATAKELFTRVMQLADNVGTADEHRALNYLAVRYPRIYEVTTEAYGRNESLTGVEIRPSRLSGARHVVDVIFSYTNRQTDVVDKHFVRVDVTEEFPFLITKLAPYYER